MARLGARAVRQSRALAHAVVRARRAAQRGRAPGHRPVGAAQPRTAGSTSRSRSRRSRCSRARCARARALWELVALAGLALLTLHAARGGVWLALYAVPLAATGFGGRARARALPRLARPVALALLAAVADRRRARAAPERRQRHARAQRTLALAHGTPVLAEDLLAEQVADAGGRVWVANPIDAFRDAGSARLRRVAARRARGRRRARARAARRARAPRQQGRAPAARERRTSAASPRIRARVLYARVRHA